MIIQIRKHHSLYISMLQIHMVTVYLKIDNFDIRGFILILGTNITDRRAANRRARLTC